MQFHGVHGVPFRTERKLCGESHTNLLISLCRMHKHGCFTVFVQCITQAKDSAHLSATTFHHEQCCKTHFVTHYEFVRAVCRMPYATAYNTYETMRRHGWAGWLLGPFYSLQSPLYVYTFILQKVCVDQMTNYAYSGAHKNCSLLQFANHLLQRRGLSWQYVFLVVVAIFAIR